MQIHESDVIESPEQAPKRGHLLEVLSIFTRLGLTSFGGPVAHLGYARMVTWLDCANFYPGLLAAR